MNIGDTKKTIKLLEELNEYDEYAYERAVLAYLQLGGLPIFMTKLYAGDSFFHTRTHDKEEFFAKVTDISIPPQELVKDFARCNRPFQSTFYCSNSRPTSYMELLENWADSKEIGGCLIVTVGLWKLKKDINVIIVTSPYSENRMSDFDKEHGVHFDSCISKYKGEELESLKLFYQFLFEKFRKPAKKDIKTYIITSAYCNIAFMSTKGESDAVYYPSVPFQGAGTNLCINKNSFKNENIELNQLLRHEFLISKNVEGKQSFIELSKIETSDISIKNNRINWCK